MKRAPWASAAAALGAALREPAWSRADGRSSETRIALLPAEPDPIAEDPFPQTLRGAEAPPPVGTEPPEAIADMLARIDALEVEGEALRVALQASRAELAKLATESARIREGILADAEPDLVRLALTVASRVVAAELATRPETIADWLAEELEGCALGPPIEVAVSPDVAAFAPEDAHPRWVVDPKLPRGTCELRAGASVVEVSPSARMRAVLEALEVRP